MSPGGNVYFIVVYDMDVARVNKMHKFLRCYFHWIQNSVFQGDITKSKLEELQMKLLDLIDSDYDSVVFFRFRSKKMFKKDFVGRPFDPFNNII